MKRKAKAKHEYERFVVPSELIVDIKSKISSEEMEVAVFSDEKQVRKTI